MGSDKLMLIDGNSILNRAFYGLQGANLFSVSANLHTNAIYGFLNILNKFIEEDKPQYLCVAFDLKAPTFRHIEFEGYKAKRKGMPPELAEQLPVMKEVLDAMNIKRLELSGFEADDILGSISLCAENAGMQVVIVTGDRDSLQLVSETTRVKMPTTRGGKTETEEYDAARVMEKYGVTPLEFIDVKGLMGDASDNIPGVPGIGEKTALDLITRFKSIESVYENIDSIEKKSVKEKLTENRELAFMSKRIATIERNMPYMCGVDELKRGEYDKAKLYELFKMLEFKSLIEKYGLSKPVDAAVCKESQVPCGIIEYASDIDAIKAAKVRIKESKEFTLFFLIDRDGSFGYSIAGIALSWDGSNSIYADFGKVINEEAFFTEFKEIFEDPEIKKYGHDFKALIVYLKWKNIDFKGIAFDTMIGAYIINPSRDSYTISGLAGEYLSLELEALEDITGKGKGRISYRNADPEKTTQAAGRACSVVHSLAVEFGKMISEYGQEELFYNIELPLVEVLSDMEFRGFKVNTEALKQFSAELEKKIDSLTEEIYSMAGEVFNINSTKQLGTILFEKLGLPVQKKTKTGYSTDAEVLEQLAPMHEIVSKLLEYRQLVKLKSTYAEGLLNLVNPATGRIHSSFNQTVTTTGRISSTEPNLQNIPVRLEMGREIRKVFVPENDSYLLSDADYSQIELRVLAHITGDENLIEAFRNNQDIHTATAVGIFRVAPEAVTPLMRSRAKTINFSIVYGIGEFSLSKDLGITRKEAKKYIDDYLDRYPGVRQYMQDIVQQGKEAGFVTTMFNRRRSLPELKASNFNVRAFGERIAMNTPIQGSAADIIKIAMVNVYRRLTDGKMKSRLILQVHDELIVETFIDEKDRVEIIVKESMENAVKMLVPLSVEVKSGMSWYETK